MGRLTGSRAGPHGSGVAGAITLAALALAAAGSSLVVAGGTTGLEVRFGLVLLAIVGTVVGVWRNRPDRVRPWAFLVAGMALSAVGDLVVLVAHRDGPLTGSVPLDAWLTAGSGVLFLIGLLDAIRPFGRGRGELGSALDALIATLASGSLIWQLLVVPAAAPGWTGTGTELAGALQIAVLLAVLVLLVRLAVSLPAGRRVAVVVLSCGVLAALVAFVYGALGDAAGGDAYSGVRASLGALANLAAAVAALHPSMRAVTAPRPATADRVSLPRTLVLGLALVVPPGVLLFAVALDTPVGLRSLAATWIVLAAAVLARLHLLHVDRDVAEDELARSQDRLASLVANTGDTVLLVAVPHGGSPQVRFASPASTRLLGRTPDQVTRLPLEAIAVADDRDALLALVSADTPLPRVGDVRVRSDTDGSDRWVEVVVDVAPQEEERSVVVTLRDVDERKRAAILLAEVALRDELTGLWNRRGLYTKLEAAVEASTSATDGSEGTTAVILGDLDGFKAVNDLAGHAAGDAVLRALARRLEGAVREADVVGRVGGDEFLVLCRTDGLGTLRAIADRVVRVGDEPFHVDGEDHRVGISVGVALVTPGSDVDDLVRRADRALYEAKAHGKGRVRFAAGVEPA